MARIRSIKPEFWTDGRMVKLPFDVRLFYIGMWNFADDWGVLEDDPETLKLRIMPADPIDPEAIVDRLVGDGRVRRATTPDGDRVLVIGSWANNQRIDKRSEGRWGNPADFHYDAQTPAEPPRIPTTPAESPAGMERKGEERNGRAAGKRPAAYVEEFDQLWELYPRKQARLDALDAYIARRRAGCTAVEFDGSVANFAQTMALEGRPKDKVMLGATFFGPNERWRDYLEPPNPADYAKSAVNGTNHQPQGIANPTVPRCLTCGRRMDDCPGHDREVTPMFKAKARA